MNTKVDIPEYTPEQQRACEEMMEAVQYLRGVSDVHTFLEKKLSPVHSLVVELRKGMLEDAYKKFAQAQDKFIASGGQQVAMKRMDSLESRNSTLLHYGAAPATIAKEMQISELEAKQLVDEFNSAYPEVRRILDKHEFATKTR